MPPLISIKTRGLQEFTTYIGGLARNIRGLAVEAVSEWLIGNGDRGLKRYYPYKYVSRKQAGVPWKSDKQRRYVMAAIRSGKIDPGYPHRTGNMQRGWELTGKGVSTRIVNNMPYTPYVMGSQTQARQPARVGWRKVQDIIGTNIAGAVRHAESVIKKWRG